MYKFNEYSINKQVAASLALEAQIREENNRDIQNDMLLRRELSNLSDIDLYNKLLLCTEQMEELNNNSEGLEYEERLKVLGNYIALSLQLDIIMEILSIPDNLGICIWFKVEQKEATEAIRRTIAGTIYEYILNGELLQDIRQEGTILILSYDNHEVIIDTATNAVIECKTVGLCA